jgi:hypothetical protein
MPRLSQQLPDQTPTQWQDRKVRQMLRNGHSIAAVANLSRLSFVVIIGIKSTMKPKRPPVRRINPGKCREIRLGRKAGRTLSGLARDYDLTVEEVLAITRKPAPGNFPSYGEKRAIADLLANGYTREQIAVHFPEIGTA